MWIFLYWIYEKKMAGLRISGFLLWMLCLTLYNELVSTTSDEWRVCKNTIFDNCITEEEDCRFVREQPCFHGDCTERGDCKCHPCWAGQFCNETDNNHPPVFREPFYDATIPSDTKPEVPFLYVMASDGDRSTCGWATEHECPCADVRYSLKSIDKGAPQLHIHFLTGGVFLKDKNGPLQPGVYEYEISVENLDGLQGSEVPMIVIVEDENDWNAVVRSRQLRAVPNTAGLTALGNASLDCSLELGPADQSITTVTPGQHITMIFTVTFQETYYAEDVHIEIFTDDENGTFGVLCEPVVAVGSNLEVEADTPVTPLMEYNSGYLLSADTAIIEIGTVANGGGSAVVADNSIAVTFDITVLDDPTLLDDGVYWVSAGIEHYQGTRLWVGQLGFTISRVSEVIPVTVVELDGPNTAPVGQPHKFTFDIRTFKRTTDLTAQVIITDPVHSSICRMEICSAGDGYCVDTTRTEAEFSRNNTASWGHYGTATIPFGVIAYGGGLADNVASLITLDVIVDVAESADGVGAQTIEAVASEKGGSPTTDPFSFTPGAAQTFSSAGQTPGITVTPSCSDPCTLVPNQAVHYDVTITVPTGATFTPATVTFVSELLADNTPAMGSCSSSPVVEFYQIDDDIACLGRWLDRADKKVTQEDAGPVINLGGLTNMGYSDEASATVRLGVVLTSSPNAVASATYTMDVTVSAGTTTITENLPVTLSADGTWPTLTQADPSPAAIEYVNSYPADSNVPPGGFAVVSLEITPEPSTQYPYVLSVGANSTSLRLLDFRVSRVGNSFKCGDIQGWKSTVGNITVGDGSTLFDTSSIDLGVVTASRWTDREATSKDAIVVEAIVQLSDDRDAVADGSLHPVAMSALIGSTRLWVGEGSINADYASVYSVVLPTVNEMSFAIPVQDTVTPGGKSKVLHKLTLKETTSLTYTVNYTTEHTWLNVTDVTIVSAGGYLPSLVKEPPSTVILGSDSGGNHAEINLGSVSNVLLKTAKASHTDDMTVTLEVSVEFANSSVIDRGSWGDVTATVLVGNGGGVTQESVTKITYKADLPKTTFDLVCPESSSSMKPREIESCNLTVTMLDDELQLRMEVDTILNSTAALNILEGKVTSVGRNINIISGFNVESSLVLTSSDNTTQSNKAVAVGTAKNTFTYTNETGYMEGDNLIVISVTFQMTDASGNEDDTAQRIAFGVSAGTYSIWTCYYDFSVERDGTERPNLDVGYTYITSSVSSPLVPGDSIFYRVSVNHTDSSNAEPTNLQIRLNLPLYVNFTEFVIQNTNDLFPVPSYAISKGGVVLSVDRLFFTDTIIFTIKATIDTSFQFRSKSTWRGTTPLQVVYLMTGRDGSSHPADEYFSEAMQYVTYQFEVTPVPDGTSAPACASPTALGMEDGTIQDCQITASFQPDVNAKASHARLNGASAWKTEARGGPFLYDRWLRVDLGRLVTLTSIKTQGGATGDIGFFDLLYSVNDALYKKAGEFNHRKSNPTAGTILSSDVVEHTLQVPVEARYVVLQLTDYDFASVSKLYNMLRVEFFGCPTGTPDADPCPAADTVLHEYDRGFTVAGDNLYVCDSQTHLESGLKRMLYDGVYAYNWRRPKMQCHVTQDGRTWNAMPDKVYNVVGYLPTSNHTIYAIFENSRGYAKGEYYGTTWNMIPTSEYQTDEADTNFVPHKAVPFVSQDEFTGETIGIYQATFDGMNRNSGSGWEPILNWNDCCTPACKLSGINSC